MDFIIQLPSFREEKSDFASNAGDAEKIRAGGMPKRISILTSYDSNVLSSSQPFTVWTHNWSIRNLIAASNSYAVSTHAYLHP